MVVEAVGLGWWLVVCVVVGWSWGQKAFLCYLGCRPVDSGVLRPVAWSALVLGVCTAAKLAPLALCPPELLHR